MELIGYLSAVLMGLSLGLIGGGGSILTVPILVYLFKIDPMTATGYSLFVVGSTAFVGAISYIRNGDVDLKIGINFILPSFLGVYLVRNYLLPIMPEHLFTIYNWSVSKSILIMLVFAILMLLASVSMIKIQKPTEIKKEVSEFKRISRISLKGFFVGTMTGFIGAGGGFLIIPALVFLMGMPMRRAVGTSLIIITSNTLFGFFQGIKNQPNINWVLLVNLAIIAISGLFLGMYFSKKVNEKNLKRGFGYFVLIIGMFILFDQAKRIFFA